MSHEEAQPAAAPSPAPVEAPEAAPVESSGGGFAALPPRAAATVAVSVVVALLFGAGLAVHLTRPPKVLGDFVQEWTSVRNYYTHRPIYAPLQESATLHLRARIPKMMLEHNAHPPAAVLLALSCGSPDYRRAVMRWNWISMGALAISFALIVGPLGLRWRWWQIPALAAVVISSNCLGQQVLQGQLNLVLLLLLTLAWIADRRRMSLTAGAFVGLAAAVKLVPAFVGLLFLARRDWRGVAGCVWGFLLLNGLTAAVLGPDCFATYFGEVVPHVSGKYQDYWANASLAGFFAKLLTGVSGHNVPLLTAPTAARGLTLAAVAAITAATAWSIRESDSTRRRDLAFALCTLAMLLASPITWDHYFLVLLPPLAALWTHAAAGRRPWVLGASLVLAFLRPTWIWQIIPGDGELAAFQGDGVPSIAQPWHVVTILSYQVYTLLALWMLARSELAREMPPAHAAAPVDRQQPAQIRSPNP